MCLPVYMYWRIAIKCLFVSWVKWDEEKWTHNDSATMRTLHIPNNTIYKRKCNVHNIYNVEMHIFEIGEEKKKPNTQIGHLVPKPSHQATKLPIHGISRQLRNHHHCIHDPLFLTIFQRLSTLSSLWCLHGVLLFSTSPSYCTFVDTLGYDQI